MNRKMIYVAALVVVLVAAVAVVVTINNNHNPPPSVSAMDDADLKVFGNVDGDWYVDMKDADAIQKLIDGGKTASEYPIADANQDGKLDSKDVEVVKRIANGESTTVWHINYHDADADGITEQHVVSTKFPIKSAIALGTGNNLMLFYCLGIHDQIKGITHASSGDKGLYGDIYHDESKVAKLGTAVLTMEFEGGKVGSSDVISKENVTAVFANHSMSCLPNADEFENYGVDVVRIPASSADKNEFVHTVMLVGLLFQEVENANKYATLSLEIIDYVLNKTKDASGVVAVASTMNGKISVGDSDYREYLSFIGVEYPFNSSDFSGKNAINISDHPEVYVNYQFDRIIHARSGLTYGQTPESNVDFWNTYTAAFSDWEHAETGQYVVSTSLPVALRVAYIAHCVYPELVDLDVLEDFHQRFIDDIYVNHDINLGKLQFILTPGMMA